MALLLKLAALALLLTMSPAVAGADGSLRYQLQPGLQIRYEGTMIWMRLYIDRPPREIRTTTQLTYTITDQRPDGFWNVYFHRRLQREDDRTIPAQDEVGALRLAPSGEVFFDPEGPLTWLDPSMVTYEAPLPGLVFMPLPTAQEVAAGRWSRQVGEMHFESELAAAQGEPGELVMVQRVSEPGDIRYLDERVERGWFALDRGIVRRAELRARRGERYGTTCHVVMELRDAATLSEEQLAPLASQYQRIVQVMGRYDRAIEASYAEDDPTHILAGARNEVASILPSLMEPALVATAMQTLAGHDESTEHRQAAAASRRERRGGDAERVFREQWIGKPAPEWSLRDLDGRSISLADYRGRIVLLDFWSRGCGACIEALPALNGIAERFEGRPVQVIGISVDRDPSNPRAVAKKFQLGYPNCYDGGKVAERFGVTAYPTHFLIGPDGTVVDIHIGYAENMEAEISARVESLLTTPPP